MSKFLARVFLLALLALVVAGLQPRHRFRQQRAPSAGPQQTVQRSVELTRAAISPASSSTCCRPPSLPGSRPSGLTSKNDERADRRTAPEVRRDDGQADRAGRRRYDLRRNRARHPPVRRAVPAADADHRLDGPRLSARTVQQSQELTASEKEQANSVIEALAQWVEKTRFTDPGAGQAGHRHRQRDRTPTGSEDARSGPRTGFRPVRAENEDRLQRPQEGARGL